MNRAPIKPVHPPARRDGARRPDDEDWWNDVLHDPRARAPKQHYLDGPSMFRLDRQNATDRVPLPLRPAPLDGP